MRDVAAQHTWATLESREVKERRRLFELCEDKGLATVRRELAEGRFRHISESGHLEKKYVEDWIKLQEHLEDDDHRKWTYIRSWIGSVTGVFGLVLALWAAFFH